MINLNLIGYCTQYVYIMDAIVNNDFINGLWFS